MALAAPVSTANASLLLVNTVDLIIVGRLENSATALAAMGYGHLIIWCATSVAIGLGQAVQVLVSRRLGERHLDATEPLRAALRFCVTWGLLFSLGGAAMAEPMLKLVAADVSAVSVGAGYLQLRFVGLVLIMVNYSYRGFLWASARPGEYLRVIVGVQLLNVALTTLLVFGIGNIPGLGVVGAGVGTTLALAFGATAFGRVGTKVPFDTIAAGPPKPDSDISGRLLRLAGPVAFNAVTMFFGFLIFVAISGRAGLAEVAATIVLLNLARLFAVFSSGIGVAAATQASLLIGAERPAEAYLWGRDAAVLGFGLLSIPGILLALFPQIALSAFTTDPTVITAARPVLVFLGLTAGIDVAGLIVSQVLEGVGAVRIVAGWQTGLVLGLFLPGAFLLSTRMGLWGVWGPLFAYRALMTIAMLMVFGRRRWQSVRV